MMRKVGITGGIGSGKSTVCGVFRRLGIPVFHADEEAKVLMDGDKDVRRQVKSAFGEAAYLPSGALDRGKMAALVFGAGKALQTLNGIVHPAVAARFEAWLKTQHASYVIKEAAILFESGAAEALDKVIVVTAPEALRVKRVTERDGTGEDAVRRRMASQWPEQRLEEGADYVIRNDNRQMLLPQILAIHEDIVRRTDQGR